ncbi:MAG: methyltransferase, TIGR04325 family [Algoriphagus sp.]|nr:methyltransferase, TIGR04325 family [Algoriphagus sp.]
MVQIKKVLKKLIPPILIDLLNKFNSKPIETNNISWLGPFENWEEVKKDFGGYDGVEILEKCKNSLLKVKNKEAVYERDSVLFNEIQYSWPILASLERVALENNGSLNVLDFGGSLGSSYFQNKSFLNSIKNLSWNIVEQDHFVSCGQEFFQNSELKFYKSIDLCLRENSVDVLLLSSVLQYLDKPLEFFETLKNYNFKYIIVDRTTFTGSLQSKIMVQTVPDSIYSASYPCWFISDSLFKKAFSSNYINISDFDSFCDGPPQIINEIHVNWKGCLLKLKE